jgi:hypothetical protein
LKFPNLKNIYISVWQGLGPPSAYQKRQLEATRVIPDGDRYLNQLQPIGVRQVSSVLHPLLGPGGSISLRTLHISLVDIDLLQSLQRWTTKDMTRLVGHLEDLRIEFLYITEVCQRRKMQRKWEAFCQGDTLHKFLTAAPHLKSLDLSFVNCPTTFSPVLSKIVPESWKGLAKLHLSHFRFQPQVLLKFLNDHRHTLKSIRFDDMVLQGPLPWSDFAIQVRGLGLSLDTCELRLGFWVDGETKPQYWANIHQCNPRLSPVVTIEDYILSRSDYNPFN